ncbi:DUF5643 domain-containing protein [Gracilibacillus salinarum]|uniref:DUF5643 domain-containing protein n=1 Tax=Gracilibacillus salinarum TaxID=2932255 RepID=A0ABY4GNJ7_9BACI|nr:DUF5643 domain-containing protein [Gracilibacillus salinarum]UOQ85776.1 DUF5643 domain-containing protein [Gracilibacillus salinarum]
MGKIIRRSIIIISIILLLPEIFAIIIGLIPVKIPDNIKNKIAAGEAVHYKIDQSFSLNNQTLYLKHLILMKGNTTIIYKVKSAETGWHFSSSRLQLKDEKGNVYAYNGARSTGNSKMTSNVSGFEPIPLGAQSVFVQYKWYDRFFEIEIPLNGEEGK